MRVAVVAAAICLSVVGLSAAGDSKAAIRKDTSIPAGGLGPALQTLAKTYDFQVLYRTEVVGELRTQGAAGTMTAPEALKQVLSGTGLSFKYLDDNTITILPASALTSQAQSTTPPAAGQDSAKEGKKSSSGGFLLAQVAQGAPASSPTVEKENDQASNKSPVKLEEVIVTAQKRNERLQDVPVPVTAISAQTLVDYNQLRLEDYYTSIPGLSITPADGRGNPVVIIRGITTGASGGGDPTVSVTVDDVPYGASTSLGGGFAAPDFDPSDLARVEVLRGPQGTLYGASSLGGLIKFVTVDPSTDGVSGRVQGGTSSVRNGAELGYNFRGSVNVPLSDTSAVRVSGFSRQDPGYIDNVETGQRGINKVDADGGRLSALWRPSEVLSLKLSATVQHSTVDGSAFVDVQPGLGDLQQIALRGTGGNSRTFEVYSAILTARFAGVNLTSVSGYGINSASESFDETPALGQCCTLPTFGVTTAENRTHNQTRKFTQEIRLSSSIGRRLEWLFGAFYTHESNQFAGLIQAANPTTGAPFAVALDESFPTALSEYAAFADLTFHVTERFDVQIGGRESENRQIYNETDRGPFTPLFDGAPSPYTFPRVDTKANAFTYLITPRFKVSPNLMVYARLASGYRPGGPNTVPGTPTQYNPDKTRNYEIGVKGDGLNHALTFDASLYYIDWRDIQLPLLTPLGLGYTGNGGQGKSQGAELSVEVRPLTGLTIGAWVAWDDAVLTQTLSPATVAAGTYGVSGDRLPYGSRFSGNLSLEQEFPVASGVTGFVGGVESYVGDREGAFTGSPQRTTFPVYARTDVRAGAKYNSWTLNLFVNNVADKRGVLQGGLGTSNPAAFFYIEPRTIGLFLAKSF